MDRAETAGLGLSVTGHVALFAALSLSLFAATKPIAPTPPSIDIQIVDKVGLADTVPNPSLVEPAASVAPELGPPDDAAAPQPLTAPPEAVAPPKPVTKPTPATPVAAKPMPKPAKPSAAPARGSRLGADFLKGVTDRPSTGAAQTPRAAAGPAVEASLAREVLRQLKPHWRAPTGADAEQLRTALSITLARDGTVTAVRPLDTTGVTDSNRGQVRLHQEAAVKAVRLAAPFSLPAEFYDAWKLLEPVSFDKRLSQ